jgi:type II secretory pathway pseudopilin PulG
MRRKNEGYALVFTLIVIMLLVVLATAIASLSTASYVNTISIEKNNKLKLAAESGVDRAQVAIRSYLKTNPDVILNPNSFNPAQVTVEPLNENGITTTVTISPGAGDPPTVVDNITGRNIGYIKIISQAKNNQTNQTKTVETTIDKGSISNVYFDRLFKSSFTVAHKRGDVSTNSFVANGNSNLNISGTMYIQADNFQFHPQVPSSIAGSFGMNEGDIYVKTNTPITYNINPLSTGKRINLYKDDKASDRFGWQNLSIQPIDMLNIIYEDSSADAKGEDNIEEITGDTDYVDENKIFTEQYVDTEPEPDVKFPITLISYKAKNVSTGSRINFQKLVNGYDKTGTSDGIYQYIIEKVLKKYEDANVAQNYLDWYGHIYKILLIDGDLEIDDDSSENYNNYVIYCTGKVTFKGNSNFYNSSIFAKSIEFPEVSAGDKNITFYGVGTDLAAHHSIGGHKLVDFNEYDKAIINEYLIKNLESYGNYMQFRTLSWVEK